MTVFVFASALALSGCVTTVEQKWVPKKSSVTSDFGQWRGQGTATKVTSKPDGDKTENWTIGLEVVSRTPGFGRIEVSGAMGVYGGTVAWNREETRILLPMQKRFVIAPNSSQAFRSILPLDISPAEIEAILFDREFSKESFKKRGITCRFVDISEKDQTAKEVCRSEKGFALERTRGFEVTSFEVRSGDGSRLKMNLKPVQSKVEERPELWSLEAPRGFKVIR